MHNTGIWWNTLIKFTKQIRISFAKIIDTKVNLKPCETPDTGFSRNSLLAFRGEFYYTSKMKFFAEIVKTKKLSTIFARTCIFDVWQDSEYASELASKVKDVLF